MRAIDQGRILTLFLVGTCRPNSSLRLNPGDSYYNSATVRLVITNASRTASYGVAVNPDLLHEFNLSNDSGDVFQVTKVSGIGEAFPRFRSYNGRFTEISP